MLPHTTKRRITSNRMSINNQKSQKIKLHGNLTSKELKKKVNQNNQTSAPRQRHMAQMKEQNKTSERQLSNEEIANLSERKLRALVIKMPTELIDLGQKMRKKRKIPKMK